MCRCALRLTGLTSILFPPAGLRRTLRTNNGLLEECYKFAPRYDGVLQFQTGSRPNVMLVTNETKEEAGLGVPTSWVRVTVLQAQSHDPIDERPAAGHAILLKAGHFDFTWQQRHFRRTCSPLICVAEPAHQSSAASGSVSARDNWEPC